MKHITAVTDLSPKDIQNILDLSNNIEKNPEKYEKALKGKNILFCFEKPSFRTLVGTEAAINDLGGHVIHTKPSIFLGEVRNKTEKPVAVREPLQDTVKVAEQFCDAIFTRVFSHKTVTALAKCAEIPVVNALCDKHHPCQALADMLTMQNHFGQAKKLKVAFVGDANNVAFSLGQITLMLGHEFAWAGPEKYAFTPEEVASLEALAETHGGKLSLVSTAAEAVKDANAVHADTWVSMGEENEYNEKMAHFQPFQVNEALMQRASPESVFMHCLPAYRGKEVTAKVLEGAQSVIYTQAKNRMVVSRGLFHYLLSQ